jgi:hypothetical protein
MASANMGNKGGRSDSAQLYDGASVASYPQSTCHATGNRPTANETGRVERERA